MASRDVNARTESDIVTGCLEVSTDAPLTFGEMMSPGTPELRRREATKFADPSSLNISREEHFSYARSPYAHCADRTAVFEMDDFAGL